MHLNNLQPQSNQTSLFLKEPFFSKIQRFENYDGFFNEKLEKLIRISQELSAIEDFTKVAKFEPTIPQVNMVHCYLRPSLTECITVRDLIQDELGISVFHRITPLDEQDRAYKEGFRCKIEIYMGEANGAIDDSIWLRAWLEFSRRIL